MSDRDPRKLRAEERCCDNSMWPMDHDADCGQRTKPLVGTPDSMTTARDQAAGGPAGEKPRSRRAGATRGEGGRQGAGGSANESAAVGDR